MTLNKIHKLSDFLSSKPHVLLKSKFRSMVDSKSQGYGMSNDIYCPPAVRSVTHETQAPRHAAGTSTACFITTRSVSGQGLAGCCQLNCWHCLTCRTRCMLQCRPRRRGVDITEYCCCCDGRDGGRVSANISQVAPAAASGHGRCHRGCPDAELTLLTQPTLS